MEDIYNDGEFLRKLEIVENSCCFISSDNNNRFFAGDSMLKFCVIGNIKEMIVDSIEKGFKYFIIGLDNVFDRICLKMLISLKSNYGYIKIYCFSTANKIKNFKENLKNKSICEEVDLFLEFENNYVIDELNIVRKSMIDYSVLSFIASCDDRETEAMVDYANKKHIKVKKIDKVAFEKSIFYFD